MRPVSTRLYVCLSAVSLRLPASTDYARNVPIMLESVPIMLDISKAPLCSTLCRHNQPLPTCYASSPPCDCVISMRTHCYTDCACILKTLATSKRYNNVPSGTHKQAVIHQQIKTKNDLVPQRAVQQELCQSALGHSSKMRHVLYINVYLTFS